MGGRYPRFLIGTLTGGEPFEQAASLASLCSRLRSRGLSVMAFTGYRLPELVTPDQKDLLDLCDIVVAGRYLRARRILGQPWRGSSNQVAHHLTDRYTPTLFYETACKIHLGPDGEMRITGFPPDEFLVPTVE